MGNRLLILVFFSGNGKFSVYGTLCTMMQYNCTLIIVHGKKFSWKGEELKIDEGILCHLYPYNLIRNSSILFFSFLFSLSSF